MSCREADALPEAPAPEPVAPVEPVALPVDAEPVELEPLPMLFSSLPLTSTWLLAYFCKSDWLPSSLILVMPAAMPEDDDDPVALPAVPVLDAPVLPEGELLPIFALVSTNPAPRDPPLPAAPVEPAPVDPAPDVPVAPLASPLWRQPVTLTCD